MHSSNLGKLFNKYLKAVSRRFFREVENHPDVTFLWNEECIYNGSIDSLQPDEVNYLQSKYNIDNFKFNNGYYTFTQQLFTASVANVYVEPEHCIAIKGISAVIKESVFYDWYRISKWKYLKARLSFFKIKRLQVAILFDGTVGFNYFHFHNDVLTKLVVIKKQLTNLNVPLVISSKLFHSALFRFYYQFDFVQRNKWYVLGDQDYLHVQKLYLIKAKQFDSTALKEIAVKTLEGLKETPVSLKLSERIFINRKAKSGRYISNFASLEPVLINNGFKIVYLEDFEISEQIALIKHSRLIAGIHGAGFTNLIFADANNVQVIEIFPNNFLPTHYYWLCNSLSIRYKAFYAGNLTSEQGFEIDIERFKEIIGWYTQN